MREKRAVVTKLRSGKKHYFIGLFDSYGKGLWIERIDYAATYAKGAANQLALSLGAEVEEVKE